MARRVRAAVAVAVAALASAVAPGAARAAEAAAGTETRPAPALAPLGPLPPAKATLVRLDRELPWLVAGGMAYAAAKLGGDEVGAALDSFPRDPRTIAFGIDRSVVGNHDHRAAAIADGLSIGLAVLPVAYVIADTALAAALHTRDQPGWVMARDLVMVAEATLLNTVLFEMAKSAVMRPRPYTYLSDLGGYPADANALRSFYSGHSATAFCGATEVSLLFTLEHAGAPLGAKIAVWTVSYLLAGSTAVLRVLAGKHFWTDVAVGSAVGIVACSIVPLAHLAGAEK
jgi:membrane-associated phospholipid phosphatase